MCSCYYFMTSEDFHIRIKRASSILWLGNYAWVCVNTSRGVCSPGVAMSAEEFLWLSLSLNTSFYATLAALKALISRAKSRPIDTAPCCRRKHGISGPLLHRNYCKLIHAQCIQKLIIISTKRVTQTILSRTNLNWVFALTFMFKHCILFCWFFYVSISFYF